jgi:hypothetical protein
MSILARSGQHKCWYQCITTGYSSTSSGRVLDGALRAWQIKQPYKPNDQPECHRVLFDRVRFMMPERDRLARNLFQVATLRDPLGLSVLRDMMALYRQSSEVEFRPGLERDKCCCSKKEEYDQYDSDESCGKYDWKHIYDCYKKDRSSIYVSADLCFLCNKWIFGKQEWSDHCREHVDDLSTFPIYFGPLLYGGVLASPGYCPFCLTNTALEPHDRVHQFLHRGKWLEHIQRHIEKLKESERQNGSIPVKCPQPEPRCPKNFDCVLELEFHLQDIHGVDMPKQSKACKRSREESEEAQPAPKKRQRRKYKQEVSEDRFFVNTTMEMMSIRSWKGSEASSGNSSPFYDSAASSWSDGRKSRSANTPLSSISGDTLIDPEILSQGEVAPCLAFNATDGAGCTGIGEMSPVSDSAATGGMYWSPDGDALSRLIMNTDYCTSVEHPNTRARGASVEHPQKKSSFTEVPIVDLTGVDDLPEPDCSTMDATRSGYRT